MPKARPMRPSADITRSKILNAALTLFMQQGYAGTSMAKLAEKADVNQTLIFHHFGNKMQLWGQVKAAIAAEAKASPINQEPTSLLNFLQDAVTQRVTLYTNCPQLSKLVGWQRLEPVKNRQSLTRATPSPFSPDSWLPAIKFLQKNKQLNAKLKPELIMIWIISSIEGMISDDVGIFKNEPDNRKHYTNMIVDVLLKGFSA